MVGLLGHPRKMRAFVSSTFRDLKFERSVVIRELEALKFDVVSMEADCKKEFNWRRWSTNQARQCDLFISLFDERVGTQGEDILVGIFISISEKEKREALGSAIKLIQYKLQRPFADQDVFTADFTADEKNEYLEAVAAKDDHRYIEQRQIADMLREGTLIKSVAELKHRLEEDTGISWGNYFLHKMRAFYRSYFDKNQCAWHRALEDESLIDSTYRVLPWELRRLGSFLFAVPFAFPFAVLFYALPWTTALFCSALLLMFVGVIILVYWPSFVWVGTKTIMARGAFGRLAQRSTKEPFHLKVHWAILNNWTGLGALSVHFADGARVFVPLVNRPDAFASQIAAKIQKS